MISKYLKSELPTWGEFYNNFIMEYPDVTYYPYDTDEIVKYWDYPKKLYTLILAANQLNRELYEKNKLSHSLDILKNKYHYDRPTDIEFHIADPNAFYTVLTPEKNHMVIYQFDKYHKDTYFRRCPLPNTYIEKIPKDLSYTIFMDVNTLLPMRLNLFSPECIDVVYYLCKEIIDYFNK